MTGVHLCKWCGQDRHTHAVLPTPDYLIVGYSKSVGDCPGFESSGPEESLRIAVEDEQEELAGRRPILSRFEKIAE